MTHPEKLNSLHIENTHPFVFVLGMHRSGTSCLTGCLAECGLYLGKVRHIGGPQNARGNQEHVDIALLHEQILMSNNGAWNTLPKRIQMLPSDTEKIREVIRTLDAMRPAGLKDPRMLLFLDEWEKIVAPPVALIGTFRHPIAVAQSLVKRDRMSPAQALSLWLQYNERLVERHQRSAFPLIEFHLANPDTYCAAVTNAAAQIGLTPDLRAVRHFVSTDLEHQKATKHAVPDDYRKIYEYLMDNRVRPHPNHRPSPLRSIVHRTWKKFRTGKVAAAMHGVDRLRAEVFLRRLQPDAIRATLFFVGSARSGATLINTMLSAHPMILLGHAAPVMQQIHDGRTWHEVMRSIVQSAFDCERTQFLTEYPCRLPHRTTHNPAQLRVIGNKHTGETTGAASTTEGFQDLLTWTRYPVTFLHVIRHPLDAISTQMRRKQKEPQVVIPNYFRQQQIAQAAQNSVSARRFIQVYLEEFIAQPRTELRRIIEQLDLPVDEDYLNACASIVVPQSRRSRHKFSWTADLIHSVHSQSADFPQLHPYWVDEASWSPNA